ncbi:lytic polysaccharide monooxygenase auxiliary activity family 9 protein [Streptomyces sp. HM190]|uniref:lytic polysaccharide monooxygenase auxiliary activity family 9 protein n=1 Tax=Streptomyces sp. HM190 TaxID=2695266 RepID=UPI001356C136|nr:lytic polysaccharide monooxygenase [Streptomyces sp. HM190]
MPAARRRAAAFVTAGVVGAAPFALTVSAAGPAAAHGSLGDPVSRVAQCYAEGPENPRSAACRAAVAAGGTQALYDWNGVRIGDVAGRHRERVPDGELCSAGNAAFKGLDLARADWPATSVRRGSYPFRYRVTAPHKGTFTVYVTRPGYSPSRPLAWDDLDLAHPVATSTDPAASGGFYAFSGTLPQRSGRHLLYTVWQRSDSPEAFYSCSDVTFGGAGAGAGAGTGTGTGTGTDSGSGSGSGSGGETSAPPSAPSDEQIADGAGRSTVEHGGHGDDDAATTTDPDPAGSATSSGGTGTGTDAGDTAAEPAGGPVDGGDAPGTAESAGARENLAETGGAGVTPYVAIGGAAVLAAGSSLLFAAARRRAAGRGRQGG